MWFSSSIAARRKQIAATLPERYGPARASRPGQRQPAPAPGRVSDSRGCGQPSARKPALDTQGLGWRSRASGCVGSRRQVQGEGGAQSGGLQGLGDRPATHRHQAYVEAGRSRWTRSSPARMTSSPSPRRTSVIHVDVGARHQCAPRRGDGGRSCRLWGAPGDGFAGQHFAWGRPPGARRRGLLRRCGNGGCYLRVGRLRRPTAGS